MFVPRISDQTLTQILLLMQPMTVWGMFSIKEAVLEFFLIFTKSVMQTSSSLTISCRLFET